MMKKISAVLLALVLCLSVVVLPVSAAGFADDYTLSAGKDIAYKVELDKATYAAGDTVTVKLYVKAAADKEFGTGAIAFGSSSAVFDQASNPKATIMANSTGNDAFTSYYKATTAATWSWLPATVVNKITTSNTADENAKYDQYTKIVIARNTTDGTHANAGDNTKGLPGADINAETEPFITFKLVLKSDLAPGTAINVGLTTGGFSNTQNYMNYYTAPGTANTVAKTTMATTDTAYMATAAAIPAAVTGPVVAKAKAQVKMTVTGTNTVADEFTFRVISTITDADWDAYFANTCVAGETKNCITEVGMVAYTGAAFDADTAKAVVNGTPAADYKAAGTDYISKDGDGAATFGATMLVSHATLANDVTYMGYVKYVDNAGIAQVIFYEAAQTVALVSNYDNIVTSYLATFPYAG